VSDSGSKEPLVHIFYFYRNFYIKTSQRVRLYPENQLESELPVVKSDDGHEQDGKRNTRRVIEVR